MPEDRKPSDYLAFMSYTQIDDEREKGRITDLRWSLSNEVAMQTGEEFPIFQDREDILTGQRWESRIESVIDGTTFLITVITPSFFNSEMCMKEVEQFFRREAALSRDDLIIPILYVPTPALKDSNNEIARNLSSRHYFIWGDLRFEESNSNKYREKVSELAEQIVSAIERSRQSRQESILATDSPSIYHSGLDGGSGFIELIAEAEDAMPLFVQTTVEFAGKLEEMGDEAVAATNEFEKANVSGKPASARLSIVHRFAKRLEEPARDMEVLANEYIDQLMRVGGGMDALIGQLEVTTDQKDLEAAKELLSTLNGVVDQAEGGMNSLLDLHETLLPLHNLSSTLRPVLKRISGAINRIIPTQDVFRGWRDDLADALERKSNGNAS